MSMSNIKYELFEFEENDPFKIIFIKPDSIESKNLFNHWHNELEIVFIKKGKSKHYINGECVNGSPGSLIIVNSEFIHSIVPEPYNLKDDAVLAIVIILKNDFLKYVIKEYDKLYFTNDKLFLQEIYPIVEKIQAYEEKENKQYFDKIHAESLILELLYYICKERTTLKKDAYKINVQKDVERMRGVFSFIEMHYNEQLPEEYVAKKFYFSTTYFSKYFKKYTGLTYTKYLTNFRIEKAKKELIYTEKSILNIALDNGFSDSRRFIITFKKNYGVTPLQYRKLKNKGRILVKK